MSIFKLLLIPVSISLFSIASPAIYAADTIDVEQCTEQKRKAYPGDSVMLRIIRVCLYLRNIYLYDLDFYINSED